MNLQVDMRLSAMPWDHRSTISLNSWGTATLEACSYEGIFILLSVDVYITVVFRNIYHLYLGRILAEFLLVVYFTTVIHDKLTQVLSVLYDVHHICFVHQFQCLSTSCLLSSVSWPDLLLMLLNVHRLCLFSKWSLQCYCV